jgi:hypothetical protein
MRVASCKKRRRMCLWGRIRGMSHRVVEMVNWAEVVLGELSCMDGEMRAEGIDNALFCMSRQESLLETCPQA